MDTSVLLDSLPEWALSWPVLALCAVVLFIIATWPKQLSSKMPGPCRNIPYFGALFEVLANFRTLPDYVTRANQKYGTCTWGAPMPNIGLLGGAIVFVNTVEAVKHVLADNFDNYVKGEGVRSGLEEFLGDGIFAADGPSWVLHRKVASNMFSRNLMRQSTLVAHEHTERLVEFLKRRCQAGIDTAIDIQSIYFRLTMDIFTYIAFGVDLKAAISDEPPPFSAAFDEVQELSEKRFFNPLWYVCKVLQLTDEERRLRKSVKLMDDFARGVITTRRRQASSDEPLGPDLLSRFLEQAKRNGEELTDKELRDIVMNFMIAGRDTTACGLSWTLFELAKQPQIQKKIREEFAEKCAGGSNVTYDTVGTMKYTHAVVQEVLRLHPSVPKDLKFAVKADTLPDGSHIPAGAAVIYTPYAMGRDPLYWENPLEFKPERFYGKQEPSPFVYPVFNAGKRLCLGKPLALMEIKMITAMLLTQFDFTVDTPHDGGYLSTLVLPMSPGLKVKLQPRSS